MDTTEAANAAIEMPKYFGHKTVWALKIRSISNEASPESYTIVPEDERYGAFTVPNEYVQKHKPEAGGYYVVYADGYKSFSPAKAFEDGYVLKTTDAGHRYELESVGGGASQMLQFIKKTPAIGSDKSSPLVIAVDGTTTEEVLKVCIDRLKVLGGEVPDSHTEAAIKHMSYALQDLEERTKDRTDRGVEGTRQI